MRLIEKAEVALFLLLARCVTGCHDLTPVQQTALDVFECRSKVLEPYLGDVLDASELVRESLKGQVDLVRILLGLGYAAEEVGKVGAEWAACVPPEPVLVPAPAAPDAPAGRVVLRAPPPAYGNRIL